jgi:excisionase family DNA binding protein
MTASPSRSAPLLTLAAAATRLAVSTKTLRRWISAEQLRSHRLGRQIRIAEEDLQAFLATRRA